MSYYEILGVSPEATETEIKQAYRKLAMQHHPDREGGNQIRFAEIKAAYEGLRNRTCSECEGRGTVRVQEGFFSKKVKCPKCWQL